jgi:hypothetical protein
VTGRQQIARLLSLVLLVVLVIVGLRGTVNAPRWDGPLKADGVAVGIALEVVLAVLIIIVRVRDTAAKRAVQNLPFSEVDKEIEPPEALRFTLRYLLTGCFVAVGVVLLSNLHLHFFGPLHGRLKPIGIRRLKPPRNAKPQHSGPMFNVHIPWGTIGYALLVLALVAAVAISIWWSTRQRRPAEVPEIPDDGVSAQELRVAVASGRAALAALDDARAAIIACYAAMERSLAERGAARGVADTPDEVLARAVARGVVRGTAASRLTALFYEARFSTHQVSAGQRDAALAALDELSAELGTVFEAGVTV